MTLTRLLITAVVIEKRPVRDVAVQYGVSRSWLYELLSRYRREGEGVFESQSRRPKTNPNATPTEVLDLIVELRQKLTATGLDAPEPKKRPKSSYIRFQAEQPNQTWQSDFTHYRLTRPDGRPGSDTEVLTWLDDHSRYALRVTAHHRVTGPIVLAEFRKAVAEHGIPASTLTDNGMVFTTRLAGPSLHGTRGRNGLEAELHRLGVVQKIAELQTLLDACVSEYNLKRPHRSLPHRATPPPPTRPDPRPLRATPPTRPASPTTGCGATASTPAGRSPCATPASSTPSGSNEPTPEPASWSLSTTSTSASSMPPPASSSASLS